MKITVRTTNGIKHEFNITDTKITVADFSKLVCEKFGYDVHDSAQLISNGKIMTGGELLEQFGDVDPNFVCLRKKGKKVEEPNPAVPDAPVPTSAPIAVPVSAPAPAPKPIVGETSKYPDMIAGLKMVDMKKSYNIRQLYTTMIFFSQYAVNHPILGLLQRQNPAAYIATISDPKIMKLLQQIADQSGDAIVAYEQGKNHVGLKITGYDLAPTNNKPVDDIKSISDDEDNANISEIEDNDNDDDIEHDVEHEDNKENEDENDNDLFEELPDDAINQFTQLAQMLLDGNVQIIQPNGGAGVPGIPGVQALILSEEDKNNITELVNMGFGKNAATHAYLACGKNLNDAANLLFANNGF